MGAFVDRVSGKLQRIPDDVLKTVMIEPKKDMTYGERRIILPKNAAFKEQASVAVTHNDIDYNGHVNNANYIRIAKVIVPKKYLSPDGIFYVELLSARAVCAILELR